MTAAHQSTTITKNPQCPAATIAGLLQLKMRAILYEYTCALEAKVRQLPHYKAIGDRGETDKRGGIGTDQAFRRSADRTLHRCRGFRSDRIWTQNSRGRMYTFYYHRGGS